MYEGFIICILVAIIIYLLIRIKIVRRELLFSKMDNEELKVKLKKKNLVIVFLKGKIKNGDISTK